MPSKRKRTSKPPSAKERALDGIYAEIPAIPGCDGSCATACTAIAMFSLEWERVKRSAGHTPRPRDPLRCPMLSPTGRCTVYSVRPYICRLWGATERLRCPRGCEPERWISIEEAVDIFKRIEAIAGPDIAGPLGGVNDLWGAIALEARQARADIVQEIERVVKGGSTTGPDSAEVHP